LPCKKIDHGDGKSSEDQGDDSEVPFGLGERMELMGENKEKGRVEIRWILLIKFYLASEIIPRIIEGVDFIDPERFLIKGVKSEYKTYEKAKHDDKNFFSFYVAHNNSLCLGLRSYYPLLCPSYSVLLLIDRHVNPFFPRRFGVPEKEVDGSIIWKSGEIEETTIKITLQNTGGAFPNLSRSPSVYDNP